MPTLSESAIASLLAPYLVEVPASILPQLSTYLDLLLKWNARTNLTAIRDPEEIVRRHFGEGLFVATQLDPDTTTLLDFGSGAGLPGLPIALLRPDIQVTLAESQNKKATFLREVVRTLNLPTEVWSEPRRSHARRPSVPHRHPPRRRQHGRCPCRRRSSRHPPTHSARRQRPHAPPRLFPWAAHSNAQFIDRHPPPRHPRLNATAQSSTSLRQNSTRNDRFGKCPQK